MHHRRTIAALTGVMLLASSTLMGQSAQRFSVQLSALSASVFGEEFEGWGSGIGFEGQLRYTPSRFSLGAGYQSTSHTIDDQTGLSGLGIDLTLSGPFIEPRYVISTNSSSLAPYVSGRLSILSESASFNDGVDDFECSASGTTMNAGGGVLIRAGNRVNVDVGATYGFTSFGDGDCTSSNGQTSTFESSSGSNVILRVGVSIGIGN